MKRVFTLLLVASLIWTLVGCNAGNLSSKPDAEAANEVDARGLTLQEYNRLLERMFVNSAVVDLQWRKGDNFIQIYEYWHNGEMTDDAELLFDFDAQSAGSAKVVYNISDKEKDEIKIYCTVLSDLGTLSEKSYSIDFTGMHSWSARHNTYEYPNEGLEVYDDNLILESMYILDDQATIENAEYGFRIYLRRVNV